MQEEIRYIDNLNNIINAVKRHQHDILLGSSFIRTENNILLQVAVEYNNLTAVQILMKRWISVDSIDTDFIKSLFEIERVKSTKSNRYFSEAIFTICDIKWPNGSFPSCIKNNIEIEKCIQQGEKYRALSNDQASHIALKHFVTSGYMNKCIKLLQYDISEVSIQEAYIEASRNKNSDQILLLLSDYMPQQVDNNIFNEETLNKILYQVIDDSNINTLKILETNSMFREVIGMEKRSLLRLAISNGDTAIAQYLDPNNQFAQGVAEINRCILSGNLDLTKNAVNKIKADIDFASSDRYFLRCLKNAVISDNVEIFSYLFNLDILREECVLSNNLYTNRVTDYINPFLCNLFNSVSGFMSAAMLDVFLKDKGIRKFIRREYDYNSKAIAIDNPYELIPESGQMHRKGDSKIIQLLRPLHTALLRELDPLRQAMRNKNTPVIKRLLDLKIEHVIRDNPAFTLIAYGNNELFRQNADLTTTPERDLVNIAFCALKTNNLDILKEAFVHIRERIPQSEIQQIYMQCIYSVLPFLKVRKDNKMVMWLLEQLQPINMDNPPENELFHDWRILISCIENGSCAELISMYELILSKISRSDRNSKLKPLGEILDSAVKHGKIDLVKELLSFAPGPNNASFVIIEETNLGMYSPIVKRNTLPAIRALKHLASPATAKREMVKETENGVGRLKCAHFLLEYLHSYSADPQKLSTQEFERAYGSNVNPLNIIGDTINNLIHKALKFYNVEDSDLLCSLFTFNKGFIKNDSEQFMASIFSDDTFRYTPEINSMLYRMIKAKWGEDDSNLPELLRTKYRKQIRRIKISGTEREASDKLTKIVYGDTYCDNKNISSEAQVRKYLFSFFSSQKRELVVEQESMVSASHTTAQEIEDKSVSSTRG